MYERIGLFAHCIEVCMILTCPGEDTELLFFNKKYVEKMEMSDTNVQNSCSFVRWQTYKH